MTSEECRNGTERVAEAAEILKDRSDIVINLQGDAPLTPPAFIEAMLMVLGNERKEGMATPAVRCDAESLKRFKEDRKAGRVGGTTVVCKLNGQALYFSKEVIPYTPDDLKTRMIPVFHHVGLYAYRHDTLGRYRKWNVGPLEQLEGLEQLRVLEHGENIRVVEVDAGGRPFWEINNPEDVARVEGVLKQYGEL
jgi:3-deoxy-manno-octulosonate cytidylyltransferase (CMP-KDO synthetase)